MGTTRINNQAVKVYSPTETVFNETTDCRVWHHDHWPLVTCDDTTEIILDTTVEVSNVQIDGDFGTDVTGNTTSTIPFRLVDTGKDFIAAGIVIGMTARNNDTDVVANIIGVDTTFLTLSPDIFAGAVESYSVSNYDLEGNMNFGTAELIKTTGATGSMKQGSILTGDSLYKMEIDITSFSTLVDGNQINIKIGGATVLTLDETDSPTGTITVFGYATGAFPTEVEISVDANIAATFSTLRVSQVSNVIFFVLDCEDDVLCYTSVLADIQTSSSSSQIKLSFDWSNLQSGYDCQGCKYITIVDDVGLPDNLHTDKINDGEFSGAGWNLGTGWLLTGTKAAMNHVGAGAGELTQTSLATDFSKSLSYDVQFTVDGYVTGSFDVKLFNGATEVANLGNISSDGIHILSTGVLSSNCDVIKFIPNTSFSQDYNIDSVSAILDVIDTGFDWRTDCFQLSDSHDCTIKLTGTNLDNAFGIDFIGLSYNPFLRLTGQLETPKFKGDKENEEDSSGISKTLYFKSEEERSLFIWQQPEHIHNFMRLFKGYDTFQVDGVDYISIDADYEPESERVLGKIPDLSNASTDVRLKTDLNENRFC